MMFLVPIGLLVLLASQKRKRRDPMPLEPVKAGALGANTVRMQLTRAQAPEVEDPDLDAQLLSAVVAMVARDECLGFPNWTGPVNARRISPLDYLLSFNDAQFSGPYAGPLRESVIDCLTRALREAGEPIARVRAWRPKLEVKR